MDKLRLMDRLTYFLKQQEGIIVGRPKDLFLQVRRNEVGWPRFLDLTSDDQSAVGIKDMIVHSDGEKMVQVSVGRFLDLLTKKTEIHKHFRGSRIHETVYRIIEDDGESYHIGFATHLLVPFWKQSVIESEIDDVLLPRVVIENGFLDILATFEL